MRKLTRVIYISSKPSNLRHLKWCILAYMLNGALLLLHCYIVTLLLLHSMFLYVSAVFSLLYIIVYNLCLLRSASIVLNLS